MRTRFSNTILALASSFVWLHSPYATLPLAPYEGLTRRQGKKIFLATNAKAVLFNLWLASVVKLLFKLKFLSQ